MWKISFKRLEILTLLTLGRRGNKSPHMHIYSLLCSLNTTTNTKSRSLQTQAVPSRWDTSKI